LLKRKKIRKENSHNFNDKKDKEITTKLEKGRMQDSSEMSNLKNQTSINTNSNIKAVSTTNFRSTSSTSSITNLTSHKLNSNGENIARSYKSKQNINGGTDKISDNEPYPRENNTGIKLYCESDTEMKSYSKMVFNF